VAAAENVWRNGVAAAAWRGVNENEKRGGKASAWRRNGDNGINGENGASGISGSSGVMAGVAA